MIISENTCNTASRGSGGITFVTNDALRTKNTLGFLLWDSSYPVHFMMFAGNKTGKERCLRLNKKIRLLRQMDLS